TRFQEFLTMDLQPRVTGMILEIPAIIDSFSLERLERSFELAAGRINEQFARGVIDADEFEQQGREAAQRFNDAILAEIDRLRANGRLTEALELALQLKLDVEVPESNAFNDTLE